MSKKKSRKRVIKVIIPKISTVFDCPFCNHKQSVEAKMYIKNNKNREKKEMIASVSCRVCGNFYKTEYHQLIEPIDIYSEWIDECEKANCN